MAVKTVNPDGGISQLDTSGMSMPQKKNVDAIYGAFGDVLNLEESKKTGVDPIVYNVYQQRSQTYDNPALQQYTYGTGVNPVFEWVKTIQTGQRSYNPQDNFDTDMLDEYKKMFNAGEVPDGALSPDEIMKQIGRDTVSQVAGQVGGRVGQAIVDPYLANQPIIDRAVQGASTTFSGDLPFEASQELASNATNETFKLLGNDKVIVPSLSNETIAGSAGAGNLETFKTLKSGGALTNVGTAKEPVFAMSKADASTLSEQSLTNTPTTGGNDLVVDPKNFVSTSSAAIPDTGYFAEAGKQLNWNTDAGAANWGSAAGAAGFSFVANLAMGAKPKQALKSAAGTMVGRVIGQALIPIPGVGAFIGGAIGGALGGRVICNELCKQGIMDRKQVVLDYKFTRDYLTPQHVIGYHVWAVWMVKQMRKGKLVSFWSHVAGHRANEIEYIYGEREKPDYLGKVYRKILEPICWTLGAFCKKTDWSVLYQKKEI